MGYKIRDPPMCQYGIVMTGGGSIMVCNVFMWHGLWLCWSTYVALIHDPLTHSWTLYILSTIQWDNAQVV